MGDKTPEKDKSGVDKSSITFRPSSNFRNMKKFFKHIYEREEARNGHNLPIEAEEIERKPVVLNHPPLPSEYENGHITPLITSPKKEIIDPEEEINQDNPPSIVKKEPVEIKVVVEDPKERMPICKDFLKNKCIRPNCTYRHVSDKDARLIKYTFCKDYQNKVCKHKKCKFVHASIFEQERYYDTGIMPPEALSHLKNNEGNANTSFHNTSVIETERPFVPVPLNIRKTPPPPPPEIDRPLLNPLAVGAQNMVMAQPPKQNGIDAVSPFTNINTIPAIINGPENITVNGTVKRPWSDSHEFLLSPRGHVAVAKRSVCEHCPQMQERYKQCTSKILALNKGVEEHIGMISSVDKMHARLYGLQIAMITIMGQTSSDRESPRVNVPMDNAPDKVGVDIRSALQVLVNRLSAEELIKSWNGAVRSG